MLELQQRCPPKPKPCTSHLHLNCRLPRPLRTWPLFACVYPAIGRSANVALGQSFQRRQQSHIEQHAWTRLLLCRRSGTCFVSYAFQSSRPRRLTFWMIRWESLLKMSSLDCELKVSRKILLILWRRPSLWQNRQACSMDS